MTHSHRTPSWKLLAYDVADTLGLYLVHVYRVDGPRPNRPLHRLPAPLAWLECRMRPSARLWFSRRWDRD
jgi:hypothetical protein